MEGFKILEGEFGQEITLSSIQGFNKFKMNTPGGGLTDGYLLHDEFNTNNSEVGVVGLCASAGTIALIGAAKNGNAWGSKNSEYLIHFPWGSVEGTAKDMKQTADELQAAQDKLVNFYKQNLKIDEAELLNRMENEIPFGSVKALEYGLINEIREDDLKPLQGNTIKEKFYNLKIEKMSKETVTKEELNAELKGFGATFLATLKNLLPKGFKNLVLKDTSGTELDFDVEAVEEIVEGTKVTAADGSYIMEDGTTYVVVSNEVTEIIAPAEDEMAKKDEEIADLKAKLEASTTANAEQETQIQNLTSKVGEQIAEFEKFQNMFSKKINNSVKPSTTEDDGKESAKAFKSDKTLKC